MLKTEKNLKTKTVEKIPKTKFNRKFGNEVSGYIEIDYLLLFI